MLAVMKDYLSAWQLLPITVILAAWVYGGGRLLRRSLKRLNPETFAKLQFKKTAVIVLIAVSAGLLTAGIAAKSVRSLEGGIFAIGLTSSILFILVTFSVLFAMFHLTLSQSFKAFLPALILIGSVGLVVGSLTATLAHKWTWEKRRQTECLGQLQLIWQGLAIYQTRLNALPDTLQQLVDKNIIKQDYLCCSEGQLYFYRPVATRMKSDDERLVTCDIQSPHPDGRSVLLANGDVLCLDKKDFESRLQDPSNKEFAEALKAAGGR